MSFFDYLDFAFSYGSFTNIHLRAQCSITSDNILDCEHRITDCFPVTPQSGIKTFSLKTQIYQIHYIAHRYKKLFQRFILVRDHRPGNKFSREICNNSNNFANAQWNLKKSRLSLIHEFGMNYPTL